MSKILIMQSIRAGRPIAIVGDLSPLREAASAMGLRVLECAVGDVDETLAGRRTDVDVFVASGCEDVSDDAGEHRALDILFDGHAMLPAATVMVLHFTTPNGMSEALADDAIPCSFVGIDPLASRHAEVTRIAA